MVQELPTVHQSHQVNIFHSHTIFCIYNRVALKSSTTLKIKGLSVNWKFNLANLNKKVKIIVA